MFYVKMQDGKAVSATTKLPAAGDWDRSYQNRNDWKSFERATEVAQQLTDATGTLYIATDAGRNTTPRYDVIEAPKIGDKVSKGFNGDYYPEGTITKISASLRRVETSTGVVFYRRRQSGAWVEGRTWSMVMGHHNERNPSF